MLELDEALPEDVLGVVLEEFPELTVELESEVGKLCCGGGCAGWCDDNIGWAVRCATCTLATVRVWSVGINGALSSDVGVGGANLEGPGCELQKNFQSIKNKVWEIFGYYFVDNFIRDLAKLLSSTKANGKIPILSSSFPSAQFSSTLRITVIISPLLNVKHPSSSSLVIRKSYNALHWGILLGSGVIT